MTSEGDEDPLWEELVLENEYWKVSRHEDVSCSGTALPAGTDALGSGSAVPPSLHARAVIPVEAANL